MGWAISRRSRKRWRKKMEQQSSKAEETNIYFMNRVHKVFKNIFFDYIYASIHPEKMQCEEFVEGHDGL
jgi:hypothetical protein